MSTYCIKCGRELKKTAGPIGPKCLQKMKPKNIRSRNGATKAQKCKICSKYDIYGENNGQRNNDKTSESAKGEEIGENGTTS